MSWLFALSGQSTGASASASILPMNIQGAFRIDWFDLLADQGSLKSLLQHHCSNASILWLSAFFMVQLSHPYNLPVQGTQVSSLVLEDPTCLGAPNHMCQMAEPVM